jgi:hypothetical protein
MAVEAPEMFINCGRVEKHGKSTGQRHGQAVFVLMKQVQVVLEAKHWRVTEGAWLDHTCHDPAPFFLR